MVLVVAVILLLPHVLGQPIEWRTTYYSILALSLALVIAALVERRMDILQRKLDESPSLQRRAWEDAGVRDARETGEGNFPAPKLTGEVGSSQTPEDRISELIRRVDDKFSQWKVPTLLEWLGVVFLVLILLDVGVLSYQDLATRIYIATAGVAVILVIMQRLTTEGFVRVKRIPYCTRSY